MPATNDVREETEIDSICKLRAQISAVSAAQSERLRDKPSVMGRRDLRARRIAPMQAAAIMARIKTALTERAQWGELVFCPVLRRHPHDSDAGFAEPPGYQPAVDAGPPERCFVANGQDLEVRPNLRLLRRHDGWWVQMEQRGLHELRGTLDSEPCLTRLSLVARLRRLTNLVQ